MIQKRFYILVIIIGITMILSSLSYVYYKQPERLVISVGKADFQENVELERIQKIYSLPIPLEQKEILKSGSIFIGCSQYMTELALGRPKIKFVSKDKDTWIYHLVGDNRPTALDFEENKLVGAKKISIIDIRERVKISKQMEGYEDEEYEVYQY